MTDFTPTEEQLACIAAAKDTEDNLLISALAGAAKTSTLVMIAEALPATSILCLAFNKRIATEMSKRLPNNCSALTLNSLGHRIWADSTGQRLTLNKDKNYEIVKHLIENLPDQDRSRAYREMPEILKAVAFGKTCGYIPSDHYANAKPLTDDSEFFSHLEEEPSDIAEYIIREATLVSLRRAWKGEIDFDDQILMPTVFPAVFPRYPLVLVDEAQDLSALNHRMLSKLARKRLIAVGDECQSIYGFRGAHEDSMNLLSQEFSMKQLTLSISFRCPQSVVREAQWRAPHMRWPEWAAEGAVASLASWSVTDIPENSAILCRNNAPIFTNAIRLLANGRYPEVIGNDIGKYILRVLRKLGAHDISQADAIIAAERWRDEKLIKTRNPGKVRDQFECMMVFLNNGENLGQSIAYAEHLFSLSGPIKMMTVHKSKGLEYPNVFILDEDLIDRDKQQERNLRYVAQTRAKETLTYIYSDGFVEAGYGSDTPAHNHTSPA